METVDDNFVSTPAIDKKGSTDTLDDYPEKDPFADVNQDIEAPKYYRLNEKVFAEPLTGNFVTNKALEQSESAPIITFVGNIGVQKRPGKQNKYFIDIEDITNMTCPQQNCHKKFSSSTLLKAHVRKIHCADKNSFICDVCGAGFRARYLLRRHSDVHTHRKTQCPVCEKMLSLRTNLSTHLRSHSEDRPHKCRCGKGFVRKSALRRHEKYVHKHG